MTTQSLQASLSGASRRRRDETIERPIASALPLDSTHVLSINESHERCAALGLSRIGAPDYSPIARADFTVTRERNRRLHAHAAPVMELLFDQVARTQCMVVLTDAQGTILHSIGDEDFLEKAAHVALAPGVNWAECSRGTNGMGTALVDERPVLVHADEHFMHANHFLTCQAAPILDPRGNILGVLDVSGDRHGYHPHTMGLVKMSARMIENHWLSDDFSDALRLHFHLRPEFIGTLMEGIVAVDRDGRCIGANRSALDLLGLSGAAVRMHTVASLLGSSIGTIVDACRSSLAPPLRLVLPGGQLVYAQARCNWTVSQPVGGTPADLNAAAALKAHVTVDPPPSTGPMLCFQRLLTGDAQVAAVISKVRRVLDRHIPVLILGEPGSGKELLARTIHAESQRRAQPFVSVQCASTPEATLETELFGYAEGFYPGVRRKGAAGKLIEADGGTLFLDEVCGLPVALQARLLRALQERKVLPLGAATPIPIDVAVIAATDRNPREQIDAQALREDLYYRLNGLAVKLPSLRDRTDLKALVHRLLADELGDDPVPALAPDVESLLLQYDWPGNLRQLSGVLHTAAVIAHGEACITREHLSDDFLDAASTRLPDPPPCAASSGSARGAETPHDTLDAIERETIRRAVEAADGNISVASKRLGISRNTIYRKLRWREEPPPQG